MRLYLMLFVCLYVHAACFVVSSLLRRLLFVCLFYFFICFVFVCFCAVLCLFLRRFFVSFRGARGAPCAPPRRRGVWWRIFCYLPCSLFCLSQLCQRFFVAIVFRCVRFFYRGFYGVLLFLVVVCCFVYFCVYALFFFYRAPPIAGGGAPPESHVKNSGRGKAQTTQMI